MLGSSDRTNCHELFTVARLKTELEDPVVLSPSRYFNQIGMIGVSCRASEERDRVVEQTSRPSPLTYCFDQCKSPRPTEELQRIFIVKALQRT